MDVQIGGERNGYEKEEKERRQTLLVKTTRKKASHKDLPFF